jgi:hypothetical protein
VGGRRLDNPRAVVLTIPLKAVGHLLGKRKITNIMIEQLLEHLNSKDDSEHKTASEKERKKQAES